MCIYYFLERKKSKQKLVIKTNTIKKELSEQATPPQRKKKNPVFLSEDKLQLKASYFFNLKRLP